MVPLVEFPGTKPLQTFSKHASISKNGIASVLENRVLRGRIKEFGGGGSSWREKGVSG